jgi:prepilin-type N-terminal cleavage/methylation domain-containing protein
MTTSSKGAMRARAGFTLIELLVALVLLSLIMAISLGSLRAQAQGFRKNGEQNDILMNLRFAMTQVDQVVRTVGSGAVPRQPMLIYGDENLLVINTNYASDIEDGTAVNVTPDLPAGSNTSLRISAPVTLPGTAISYPTVNYNNTNGTPSRAETIMFFFRPDSTTADANDFVLFEQVNTGPPELVARNLKRVAGRDFFEYFTQNVASGVTTIQQVTRVRTPGLPLRHTEPQHGSPADIGASALTDSIRTVRLTIAATNGQAGAAERQVQGSVGIRLANNGLVQLQTCGDDPILTTNLTTTPNNPGDPPAVTLQWNASADETAGERDIAQYNIYYRLQGATEWSIFAVVPPAGQPSYEVVQGSGLLQGQTYQYAVAAQDCSPRESALRLSAATIVN